MVPTASLLTGGDVAPIRDEGMGLFGDLEGPFRGADISFVNLEHSLSTKGELVRGKEFFHRGPPASADGLAEGGLSAVNLANNHVLDYGEEALLETFSVLGSRAIPYFGAGVNLETARTAHVVEHDGLRVGLLGYTTTLPRGFAATDQEPGVNPLSVHTAYHQRKNLSELPGLPPEIVTWADPEALNRLRTDVAATASKTDVVMVYLHWGTSMTSRVHDFQRQIGRAAVDSGAHAVFGGHQHVLSGIEFHNGHPIVHSTGNLIFDKWEHHFTDETRKTVIVGATLEPGHVRDLVLLPVWGGVQSAPKLLSRSDPLWEEIRATMERLCHGLGTEVTAGEDGIEVSERQTS